MKTEHVLKIGSLHDGTAKCSCRGWEYSIVGPTTRENIEEQFQYHKRQFADQPSWQLRARDSIENHRDELSKALRALEGMGD